MRRCGTLLKEGSPRAISWMCKALAAERLWLPDPLDDLVDRAVAHPDDLFPSTLCHLGYICFVSGHVPGRLEHLARIMNDTLLRCVHVTISPCCLNRRVGFFIQRATGLSIDQQLVMGRKFA